MPRLDRLQPFKPSGASTISIHGRRPYTPPRVALLLATHLYLMIQARPYSRNTPVGSGHVKLHNNFKLADLAVAPTGVLSNFYKTIQPHAPLVLLLPTGSYAILGLDRIHATASTSSK